MYVEKPPFAHNSPIHHLSPPFLSKFPNGKTLAAGGSSQNNKLLGVSPMTGVALSS